jgi:hypothetical protein
MSVMVSDGIAGGGWIASAAFCALRRRWSPARQARRYVPLGPASRLLSTSRPSGAGPAQQGGKDVFVA